MREFCSFPSFSLFADSASGMVKCYPSVIGVVDDRLSVVEPGAFTKTIAERGPNGANRILALRDHNPEKVIGHPVLMAEHSRAQLPEELLTRFPQAVGGLYCETQVNLKTDDGRDAFHLLQAGDLREWSFGFDDLTNGGKREYDASGLRHMRELRVWEYSCVAWGGNEATRTISVNSVPREFEELFEKLRRAGVPDVELQMALNALLSSKTMMHAAAPNGAAHAPVAPSAQIERLLIDVVSVENEWLTILR